MAVSLREAPPALPGDSRRSLSRSPRVATDVLLRGPTAAEWAAVYWSFFSTETAGMLRSVRFTGGTGFGDFRDFRRLIPNAGSSYGNTALLEHGGGIAALPRRDRLAPGLRHPSQTGAGPGG